MQDSIIVWSFYSTLDNCEYAYYGMQCAEYNKADNYNKPILNIVTPAKRRENKQVLIGAVRPPPFWEAF